MTNVGDAAKAHPAAQSLPEMKLPGISIVCVFNNPEVRRECLDASIERYSGHVEVDYIPVDNVDHAFTSAGAALNHAARLARHDVVAFAHQDVFLHSIDRIAEAGALMVDGPWGILGSCGIADTGRLWGRMRDRTQLIGRTTRSPRDVDSVDEVLFLIARDRILDEPLTEDPDLAWHAYAVEYGLRMRRRGLRVGGVDLAITHNSLTVNLARLDVAHRRVADLHPAGLPVRTTCGTIGQQPVESRPLAGLRGGRRPWAWLQESMLAAAARGVTSLPVVLSDMRTDVDGLEFSADAPLHLINVDLQGGFVEYARELLLLSRCGKPVLMRTVSSVNGLCEAVAAVPEGESLLVADLTMKELRALPHRLGGRTDWLLGLAGREFWLLSGPATRAHPERWRSRRAVPLGSSRLPASSDLR